MNLSSLLRHFRLWLASFWLLVFTCIGGNVTQAQDISATVAPNVGGSDNFVDILNTTASRWHFYSDPAPSPASMAKVDSNLITEAVWPSVPNFAPDPNHSLNRLFPGSYLRVYPKSLPIGTVIVIPFTYGPVGTTYHFRVTVTDGAQVTSLLPLDPNPTSAVQVRWRVTFDTPITAVTPSNFAFVNAASMPNLIITSVLPDGPQPNASWTITAQTPQGTGILGLRWVGHLVETPGVPNSFTGFSYNFQASPVVTQDVVESLSIYTGETAGMQIEATARDGATITYQWFQASGPIQNRPADPPVPNANSAHFTTAPLHTPGNHYFYCRASVIAMHSYSRMCAVTVLPQPEISLEQPAGQLLLVPVDYGNQIRATTGATKIFMLRNIGTAPLTISSVSVIGTHASEYGLFTGGMLTSLPAATGFTNFEVNFTPAAIGTRQAILRVISNDRDEGTIDINLTGQGIPPAPQIISPPVSQTVMVGGTATFTALASEMFAGNAPASLIGGAALLPGEFLLSPNHAYKLLYQADGNLVLYSSGDVPLWNSGTNSQPGQAVMQADGNLVVYGPGFVPQYSTGTSGNPNAMLTLQDDGNLVIYAAGGGAVWSSGTSGISTITSTVQWQVSTDAGANFNDLPGATGVVLKLPNRSLADNQVKYRVRFTNLSGTATSGEATLIVLNQLASWRQTHSLPADGSQDLATPANDGVANLLKYAFNMAPNAGDLLVPNRNGLPIITTDGQNMTFIFLRRKASTQPGISYIPEMSTDLQTWTPVSLTGASMASLDTVWEQVTVTVPVPSPGRGFGRVRVQ